VVPFLVVRLLSVVPLSLLNLSTAIKEQKASAEPEAAA